MHQPDTIFLWWAKLYCHIIYTRNNWKIWTNIKSFLQSIIIDKNTILLYISQKPSYFSKLLYFHGKNSIKGYIVLVPLKKILIAEISKWNNLVKLTLREYNIKLSNKWLNNASTCYKIEKKCNKVYSKITGKSKKYKKCSIMFYMV